MRPTTSARVPTPKKHVFGASAESRVQTADQFCPHFHFCRLLLESPKLLTRETHAARTVRTSSLGAANQ